MVMGIMTRLTRLFKADLHGVMDQLEDKELLLRHYLREMESNLQEKKGRLKLLHQEQQKREAGLAARQQEIDTLERDLQLALRKEKDEIARLLIRKLRLQQREHMHLNQQLEALRREHRSLATILEEQGVRYETLKVKAASAGQTCEQNRHWDESSVVPGEGRVYVPDDGEIELELMRRKEEVRQCKGGEA